MTRREAINYRKKIELAANTMKDEDALNAVDLFGEWKIGVRYSVDTRIRYNEVLYRVIQSHTSQEGWTPDIATSLFAKVLIPQPEVLPEWEQPSSTNPYMKDDKVKHNGLKWISTIDNNVWEPSVYGWDNFE